MHETLTIVPLDLSLIVLLLLLLLQDPRLHGRRRWRHRHCGWIDAIAVLLLLLVLLVLGKLGLLNRIRLWEDM